MTDARVMVALQGWLERNRQAEASLAMMVRPTSFDHALEALIFAAYNRVDCSQEREVVWGLFRQAEAERALRAAALLEAFSAA